MEKLRRWYLHRKWILRQRKAWRLACQKHYEFEGKPIEYWVKQELDNLKSR